MTIEQAMFSYVTGRPAVSALIASRFYPVAAPQEPTAPFAVYARSGASRDRSGSGPTGAVEASYAITCWSKTYPEAQAAAKAIRDALDGAAGPWSQVAIGLVQADDVRDDFNADLQLFGRVVTVTIQYQEA